MRQGGRPDGGAQAGPELGLHPGAGKSDVFKDDPGHALPDVLHDEGVNPGKADINRVLPAFPPLEFQLLFAGEVKSAGLQVRCFLQEGPADMSSKIQQ
jgi:hypothetical protein